MKFIDVLKRCMPEHNHSIEQYQHKYPEYRYIPCTPDIPSPDFSDQIPEKTDDSQNHQNRLSIEKGSDLPTQKKEHHHDRNRQKHAFAKPDP